jgi:hypothetical protein
MFCKVQLKNFLQLFERCLDLARQTKKQNFFLPKMLNLQSLKKKKKGFFLTQTFIKNKNVFTASFRGFWNKKKASLEMDLLRDMLLKESPNRPVPDLFLKTL